MANSLSDLGFLTWRMEALSFTEKGTVVEPRVLSWAQRLPHKGSETQTQMPRAWEARRSFTSPSDWAREASAGQEPTRVAM